MAAHNRRHSSRDFTIFKTNKNTCFRKHLLVSNAVAWRVFKPFVSLLWSPRKTTCDLGCRVTRSEGFTGNTEENISHPYVVQLVFPFGCAIFTPRWHHGTGTQTGTDKSPGWLVALWHICRKTDCDDVFMGCESAQQVSRYKKNTRNRYGSSQPDCRTTLYRVWHFQHYCCRARGSKHNDI